MRKISLILTLSAVFAVQILATDPIYLPKVAYRVQEEYSSMQKIEYEYDAFGHILNEVV